ncbi:MAG: Metal-dependent hydrolase [Candidatus Moranbacteria bacterium GW2011_GWE2_47_10]|nr:MAG: Metal-dependent hydrolase [Candidatus Moranbacteria bacterium GW2011_GWE2_47_10]
MERHAEIKYTVKRSGKAKSVRLSVSLGGEVEVTAPTVCSAGFIEEFVWKNSSWIADRLAHFSKFEGKTVIRTHRRDYLKFKEAARKLVKERIAHFNKFYNFKFNRIAIRNQKTLWGSCSGDGNLNFNYALVKIRPDLADYVIVHEMCHLWHFDHSRDFWELVSRTVPDYKRKRKDLRETVFV